MEGDVITMQEIFLFEKIGRDAGRQGHRPLPRDRRPAEVLRAAQGRRASTCRPTCSKASRRCGDADRCHGRRCVRRRRRLVVGGYSAPSRAARHAGRSASSSTRLQEVVARRRSSEAGDSDVARQGQHDGPLPALDRAVARHGARHRRWRAGSSSRACRRRSARVLLMALASAASSALVVGDARRARRGRCRLAPLVGFALPFLFLQCKRTRRHARRSRSSSPRRSTCCRARSGRPCVRDRPEMVADEMPEPVGPEFRKTFDEQNFGLPLKDALNNLARAHAAPRRAVLRRPPC